jgi:LCP family protein required for cell wall assembly
VPDVHQTDNFLVLGTDQRPGWTNWRSDTIMVVAVDYAARQVGIISVPRDLWVNIPGYGMSRINQADFLGESRKYPGGGPALVSKILEENLGIKTGHWVRIKQDGLVELVGALGGVTVTLDCPLREITPHPTIRGRYEHFELPAGQVFLDGPTAKKFATYRYASNDFSRARRQQQLIWAIRDRALQIDAIPKIPELWQALSKSFTTDLSLLDVIRLARLGSQLESDQVRGLTFRSRALADTRVSGGAQVLTIRDKRALLNEVNSLFAGKPISQQGREGSGRCP